MSFSMRDTDTLTRLLQTAAAVAIIGVLFAAAPARAQDADDEPVRDDGLIGNLMRGLGASDGSNGINYRERSPLVVPRNLTLPPPEQRRPEAANWPKDPDVLERRAAREAAKKRDRQKEADPREMTRIQPEPNLGSARARTATVAPQPGLSDESNRINENRNLLSPSQLGVTSNLAKLFGVKREDDNVKFTAEPPRESLTQPPPGYQTPSSTAGYSVSGDYRSEEARRESERQNPSVILPPGRF
jgi:hypothetical protein